DHRARVATGLDAFVRGLPDVAVARPAAELGPDDQLGPDPGDAVEVAAPAAAPVARWRRIERRGVGRERLHYGEQPLPRRRGEPRAHLAGEPELAVLVHPDRDRAEIASVPLPRRPAADDQLLLR